MTGSVLIGILFCLHFVSSPCEGQINLPPGGDMLIVAPGDDATIEWTFNNTETLVFIRAWIFKRSSATGLKQETIASISRNKDPEIEKNISLPRVEIKTPATLILRNVDHRYDGTYEFSIVGGGEFDVSDVRLFVAVNPNVTINCSSLTTVDEGESVTCLCEAYDVNPPDEVNVTWYNKDGVKQDVTRTEKNVLSLSNVNVTHSGTYKCEAQTDTFNDEKSIEVIVNFTPEVTSLTTKAVFGKLVTISCEAIGLPEPTYTIIHNNTYNVSTEKTYTIAVVKYSDAGSYQCIAKNKLGLSSKTFNLIVIAIGPEPLTTTMPTKNSSNNVAVPTTNAYISNKSHGSVVVWHIVVSLLSGIIIGVLLSCIVGYSQRQFRNKKPAQSNPEQTSSKIDSIYQDLDLSKMNQEENYQTLGAVNSDKSESDYTELNLARNEEDNYQGLQTSM